MSKALTMDQLIEAEERREATQLSVDDWVERVRVVEGEAVEYQNKYYAEKQKCQNTHERALWYLKEHGLLDIKFRGAEADKTKLVGILSDAAMALEEVANPLCWQAVKARAVLKEVSND